MKLLVSVPGAPRLTFHFLLPTLPTVHCQPSTVHSELIDRTDGRGFKGLLVSVFSPAVAARLFYGLFQGLAFHKLDHIDFVFIASCGTLVF